jgi:hypothetical protein
MKVYVTVEVLVDEAGITHPTCIIWDDGRRFEITSISDVRRAASQKAGGNGIRYTCRIGDRDAVLYYENPKWFVASK